METVGEHEVHTAPATEPGTSQQRDQQSLNGLIRQFFAHAPSAPGRDDAQRREAVLTHRRFARERPPRTALVAVDQQGNQEGPVLRIVTDDMPFLVDSVTAVLARAAVAVRAVVHPVVVVRRSASGELVEVLAGCAPQHAPTSAVVESWMRIELDPGADEQVLHELAPAVREVLADVRMVVQDTAQMLARQRELAEELTGGDHQTAEGAAAHGAAADQEVADTAELLRWLAEGNFTPLGYRRYERTGADGGSEDVPVPSSGLGVLRDDEVALRSAATRLPDDRDGAGADRLVLTQASARATVHRAVYPFFVAVRTTDDQGVVTGEHRFLGIFSVGALHENVLDIPVLARRTRTVISDAGLELNSYSGQAMLEVIQTYPRTELFATDTATLARTVNEVLSLDDDRAVRLFLRRDTYGRFVSCLVYLPRDRYTTRSREAIQQVLMDELDGESVEHTARVTESSLALLHITVHTRGRAQLRPGTQQRLQELVAQRSQTWDDRFVDALTAVAGGPGLAAYAPALPEAYKEDFDAARAVADVGRLAGLRDGGFDLDLRHRGDVADGQLRLTLYLGGGRVSLTDVLPLLQSMDVEVLDERPYPVARPDGLECWIYDFGLAVEPSLMTDDEGVAHRFTESVHALWRADAEADRFNALVLHAGLDWRQAVLVRALARYLRQAGMPYSQPYVETVAVDNAAICAALVALFEARLHPGPGGAGAGEPPTAEALHPTVRRVSEMIDEVAGLDADRILRAMLSVVQATTRTNYWVTDGDGAHRPYLSLKLDPMSVAELPQPRPQFEIFVHSPRVEGVHLRFGPVARGGLRWSDRREDYRTEVLGLVKAQAVKNAVIVPVGAKGGFVLLRPPAPTGDPGADREALAAEGVACYRLFVGALLDVTDNYDPVSRTVLPPARVLRRDGDDTYLVVAADKGTAAFSDIANAVAAEYGYWLGDAFASGGSAGYDHKAMGITARGAWESVRRHFRELGLDTQTDDITVVGIGDMSGDVFGNGMLLSRRIRLLAAFDHRHVFLDPDPDAARSYTERQRLFSLARSSWADYDTTLISAGGGVYPRTLKSVPISAQVRQALGLADDVEHLSPPELVRAILLAPADLLWNGGIGTYVKAGAETHAEVGDKGDDAVRVNGGQLRVRVVGEGGNLGLTQRGRIEYDRAGGRINTDALDNSAGVDCSDHEVNIKILIDALVTDGTLPAGRRLELLESMTDEVSTLVLADNVEQNELMGITRANAGDMVGVHARLVNRLEADSGLDRELAVLPERAGFAALARTGAGLSSPELATLMAHVKLALKQEVLASDLPDADAFAARLPRYFPRPLREEFPTALPAHPLRRQIVTTQVVNEVVDSGGVSYAFRLNEETGASTTDAVRAHLISTEIFDLGELRREIRRLGPEVPTACGDEMALEVRRLLDRTSRWLLSNRPQPLAVRAEISRFAASVRSLRPRVGDWLRGQEAATVEREVRELVSRGAPPGLARRVMELLHAYCLLDVVEIADIADRDVDEVGQLYYALSEHLEIDVLLTAVSELDRGDRWHSLARLALRDDLYGSLRSLTVDVLSGSDPSEAAAEKIEHWEQVNASRMARARATLADVAAVDTMDLAMASVAARQVRSMVRSTAMTMATAGPQASRS